MKKNILLIHGWDYNNYYGRTTQEAWNNRMKFISELEKKYNVYYPSLPGFGTTKEPKTKSWTLDDFADYINEYILKNKIKVDYILGYSFGGAVALRYKTKFNQDVKEILASPALIRNEDNSKHFIKTPKLLNPIRNFIRDIYLIKKVKVKEMVYGTKFLRNTYQNIVRVKMLDELETLNPNDFQLIYGSEDNMVNPQKVIKSVKKEFKNRIVLIDGGGHDIANTHTSELIQIINNFTN
jgi:pimeloyl-ACP methyl ester carboxylesterase